MKRLLLILAIGMALAGCGTAEPPVQSASNASPADVSEADTSALLARPTLTPAEAAPNVTSFPTEPPTSAVPPTSVPPTAEPVPATAEPVLATAEPVPATAEPVPATAEPIQVAGADPGTWVTYQNDQYGFSVSYPPCLGETFEEPPYSRPAGLYTEGYNRKLSREITTTLNLGSGPVSPDCVAQVMSILVWELEGYSNYNIYSELTYDPATDTWFTNGGRETEPDDSYLVDGEGWRGKRIGFGDAEISITGLAVPHEQRNVMIEISFGHRFSYDGPPDQGLDSDTIEQILQTLRLTP